MKKTRSSSYEFTISIIDGKPAPDDMIRIDELKRHIKWYNKRVTRELKQEFPITGKIHLRLKLQGRLGKSNPAAEKYKQNGYQSINLIDATTADVYVYGRDIHYPLF